MTIFSSDRLKGLQASEAANLGPYTVMIVDDEVGNRSVMRNILAPYFKLIEATDGADALAKIAELTETATLACIVSDHRMPRLTGVQLFEQTQRTLPQTCRIIVTGFVDIDTILDSINKAEIYRFIVKPYEAADFLLTIRRAVEAFDLQSQVVKSRTELEERVRLRTHELAEERRRLEQANQELERYSKEIFALYNNASCGYHSVDITGTFVEVNDTELAWLGEERHALIGKKSLRDVLSAPSYNAILAAHPEIEQQGWLIDLNDIEAEFVSPDGTITPVLFNARRQEPSGNSASISRFTVFDITDRKLAEDRIRHMAHHDPLTGLPNRMLLQDRLSQAVAYSARTERKVAIVYIDLDHFKQINDSLGHQIGDELLKAAAKRLGTCIRASDTLARIGGDEFLMILPFLANDDDIAHIISKAVQTLTLPFEIEGHSLQISASIGSSIYPNDANDMGILVRYADAAMYQAKVNGRNNAVKFTPEHANSSDL